MTDSELLNSGNALFIQAILMIVLPPILLDADEAIFNTFWQNPCAPHR
jgi:hypothetical protein